MQETGIEERNIKEFHEYRHLMVKVEFFLICFIQKRILLDTYFDFSHKYKHSLPKNKFKMLDVHSNKLSSMNVWYF